MHLILDDIDTIELVESDQIPVSLPMVLRGEIRLSDPDSSARTLDWRTTLLMWQSLYSVIAVR